MRSDIVLQIRLKAPGGLGRLTAAEAEPRPPGPGEIQVALKASSLNYHDYVVALGLIETEDGRVPLSDAAGVVCAVGEGVTSFREGDRVLSVFFPNWQDGAPSLERLLGVPGDHVDGFATTSYTGPAAAFTAMPKSLDFAAAATLGCAGLTAWRAVVVEGGLEPGDWVLVQGSGGVSVFALQFARLMGCRVIATSSSEEKLARLGALGADALINYRETPNWGRRAREISGGGVRLVVEVGGAGTAPQSIRAVGFGGVVAMIGILTGISGEIPTAELFQKNARIQGITVGSRRQQEDMVAAVDACGLVPVVDSHYPLAQLADAFRYQESQRHFGKICIDLVG